MDQELRDELGYLRSAVDELLRRVTGTAVPPAPDAADSLPDPIPGEGIASYAMRCGQFVGGPKGEQAIRAAGSLFGGYGQMVVDKHGGSWKKAVWEFINGDPAYKPDPQWGVKYPQG